MRKKGVPHIQPWQSQQISYFIRFFFSPLVRSFMKPSNAVSLGLNTHPPLSLPSLLYQLGHTAQQRMQKQPQQQHLSAPLCLLFAGWLAACRLEIRSRMCWANTLELNTDLSLDERSWKPSHTNNCWGSQKNDLQPNLNSSALQQQCFHEPPTSFALHPGIAQ